jgi:bla regulator protein blaR1
MMSWFFEMLIATSVLMALILCVRGPVARHFGPRVAYALWLIPAIRAVLPPLPNSWIAVQGDVIQNVARALPAIHTPVTAPLIDAAALWGVGVAAFFAWHAAAYARFSWAMRASATPLFQHDAIAVGQTALVQSPLAFGVIDKAVMLPSDFAERYDDQEQHLAIGHELMHHRRGDLAANAVALGLLSLHWFNPLAHFAFRAFRADQEAACDASVLAGASDDDRHAYGSALVKSALGHAPLVACRISGASRVKTRLGHILAARHTQAHHETGISLAGIALVAGLGLTASGMALPPAVGTHLLPPILASQDGMKARVPRLAQNQIRVAALPHAQTSSTQTSLTQTTLTEMRVTGRTVPHPSAVSTFAAQTAPAVKPVLAALTPSDSPTSLIGATPADTTRDAARPPVHLAGSQSRAEQCEGGGGALLTSAAVIIHDGTQRSFAVAICAPKSFDQATRRTAMLTGLSAARTKIADDPSVPDEQRADVLAMIDLQINELAESEATLL